MAVALYITSRRRPTFYYASHHGLSGDLIELFMRILYFAAYVFETAHEGFDRVLESFRLIRMCLLNFRVTVDVYFAELTDL